MLCPGKYGKLGKNLINPTRFILTVPTYLYKFCIVLRGRAKQSHVLLQG